MEWQNWCRLCAKEDSEGNFKILTKQEKLDPWECDDPLSSKRGTGTAASSLLDAMQQYFYVDLMYEKQLPKKICSECYSLLTSSAAFLGRVAKVEKMFQMIKNNMKERRNLNLESVRLQFGIVEDDWREEKHQSLTAQHYAPPYPTVIDESPIVFENELTLTANPLSQSNLDYDIKEEFQTCMEIEGALQPEVSEYGEQYPRTNKADDTRSSQNLKKSPRRCARKNVYQAAGVSASHTEVSNGSADDVNNAELEHTEPQKSSIHHAASICPKCHMAVKNLRLHLIRKHAASDDEILLKCDKCPSTFVTKRLLESHARAHLPIELKKIYPCPHCDKKFSTKAVVQTHIKQVHLDERPFVCEECGVAVRTKAVLKDHMLVHTDAMRFKCDVCGKAFKHQSTMRRHKDLHNPTKYTCTICGAELNTRVTFNRHRLVHLDVMQHKCDYCGRAFKRSQTLKNHLLLHTGLKPYTCDFCDATFTSGPNCRAHKKRNHPKELAAWEASGNEMYTHNIPKLAELKAFTKAAKKSGSHLFTHMRYEKDNEQERCYSPRSQ